jgi:hypothetical protein
MRAISGFFGRGELNGEKVMEFGEKIRVINQLIP